MQLNRLSLIAFRAATMVTLANPVTAAQHATPPLQGFWHRTSLQCAPGASAACHSLKLPLDADLAIAITGDTVVTTRPDRDAVFAATVAADTLVIDSRRSHWLAGHRGYSAPTISVGPLAHTERDDTTYHVYRGSNRSAPAFSQSGAQWTVSADGRTLTCRQEYFNDGASVVVVQRYHRSA
ncbi:MAG TPA: hypothetical protein VGM20_13805 [Gemmatimonadales bacterium]